MGNIAAAACNLCTRLKKLSAVSGCDLDASDLAAREGGA
jgi:hypothetical protein